MVDAKDKLAACKAIGRSVPGLARRTIAIAVAQCLSIQPLIFASQTSTAQSCPAAATATSDRPEASDPKSAPAANTLSEVAPDPNRALSDSAGDGGPDGGDRGDGGAPSSSGSNASGTDGDGADDPYDAKFYRKPPGNRDEVESEDGPSGVSWSDIMYQEAGPKDWNYMPPLVMDPIDVQRADKIQALSRSLLNHAVWRFQWCDATRP